jgi:hypothetical protein
MYYKVLKDNKVIDVLDHLTFVRYQKKHNIMIACDESRAQAIVSSDGKHVWHIVGLYSLPVDGYDTVEIIEINKYEYNQLKLFNLRSVSEIIDEYTLQLIEGGLL